MGPPGTKAEHDLSAPGDVLARVAGVARASLGHYPLAPATTAVLHQVSENATFLVDEPGGRRAVLRVHRLGYHSVAAIESELAWMTALRDQAGVRAPRVLPAGDGSRVVRVADPASGEERACVLFEWLAGHEPEPVGEAHCREMGELAARMHRHSRAWRRPPGFTRFRWDTPAALGHPGPGCAPGRWGRWQAGVGVGQAERAVLGRLEGTLRRRLLAFGTGADRFGLVHADLRAANLLVDGGGIGVIDFDDCGQGWYLYDLATCFSFFEERPDVPELAAAWLAGYRSLAPIEASDEAEVWTFILLRRLLLVAWLGSHPAAAMAASLGAGYTLGTCDLAERYLSTHA